MLDQTGEKCVRQLGELSSRSNIKMAIADLFIPNVVAQAIAANRRMVHIDMSVNHGAQLTCFMPNF